MLQAMSFTYKKHGPLKRDLGAKMHPLQHFMLFLVGLYSFIPLGYAADVPQGFYGQVNKSFLVIDDGEERNSSIVDNNVSSTRFGWQTQEKFVNGVGAGLTGSFLIELQSSHNASSRITQDSFQFGFEQERRGPVRAANLQVRHSRVGLQGQWGGLQVGQTSSATDGITEGDLGALTSVFTSSPARWGGASLFRGQDGQLGSIRLDQVTDGFDGIAFSGAAVVGFGNGFRDRFSLVRYSSPKVNGFELSGAYTTERHIDIALRHKKVFEKLATSFGIGYVRYDTTVLRRGIDDSLIAGGLGSPDGLPDETSDGFAEPSVIKNQISGHFSVRHELGTALTLAAGKRNYSQKLDGIKTPWFIYAKLSQELGPWAVALEHGRYSSIEANFVGQSILNLYGVGIERTLSPGVATALFARNHQLKRLNANVRDLNVIGLNLKIKF